MQPVNWYIQRLKSMSVGEILWRVKSLLRDQLDRIRIPLKLFPSKAVINPYLENPVFGFSLPDISDEPTNKQYGFSQEWIESLKHQADLLCQHKFTFFDLKEKYFGHPVEWHKDQNLGIEAPKSLSLNIDYRDIKIAGDCKLVWEPNRHQHLLVLARTYKLTGEEKYAQEIVDQINSWFDSNPFGYGMNWRSALELGVRVINWVWILELIKDADCVTDEWKQNLIHSSYLHVWDSQRKYSQGSSANNHLIGEVAGVFVAVSYFNKFPRAQSLIDEAKAILEREILLQSFSDGCTREHGLGYQYFVLQFYIVCGLVGRWTNNEFSLGYWERVEKMLEFTGLLSESGDEPPMFGDCDDGYVLNLGQTPRSFRDLHAVGAILFNRYDFKLWSGGISESAMWFFGRGASSLFKEIEEISEKKLESHSFDESGYYLLQAGHAYQADAISMFVDCAELGYTSIAAHGNADALSFVLKAYGKQILIDPGTYDYFTYPQWRNYFRSTRAHNTIEVDGVDQSCMLGPFLWGERATSKTISWEPTGRGGTLIAEHDGYHRLNDPVTHRREFELNGADGLVKLTDYIEATDKHVVRICFHVSEHCTLVEHKGNVFTFNVNGNSFDLELDEAFSIEVLNGSEQPVAGWVSRGYHVKQPIATIYGVAELSGSGCFNSYVKLSHLQ